LNAGLKTGVSRDGALADGPHEDDMLVRRDPAAALSFPKDRICRFADQFFLLFGQ
jgi:hypothetical protein